MHFKGISSYLNCNLFITKSNLKEYKLIYWKSNIVGITQGWENIHKNLKKILRQLWRFHSVSALRFTKAYIHWSCFSCNAMQMYSSLSTSQYAVSSIITHGALKRYMGLLLNSFEDRQQGLFCLWVSGANQPVRPAVLRKSRLVEVWTVTPELRLETLPHTRGSL